MSARRPVGFVAAGVKFRDELDISSRYIETKILESGDSTYTKVLRLSWADGADNYLNITAGTADVRIEPVGSDTNIPLVLAGKGTGGVTIEGQGGGVTFTADGNITAGQLVYVSGWDTTESQLKLKVADADAAASARDLYWVPVAILDTETDGVAYKTGALTGQNTDAASAVGDPVYLSTTAGGWTLTAPSGTADHVVEVGTVAVKDATTGVVHFDLTGESGLNLADAPEAAVDASADYFAFLDGGATGTAAKEALADLFANVNTPLTVADSTITSSGTVAGNGLNFTGTYGDHVIDIQPGATLGDYKAIYVGTWGTEAQFNDGGGLFRIYGKVGDGGTASANIFVRTLTESTSGPIGAQFYTDSSATTPGPTVLSAVDAFAVLNAGGYLAAKSGATDGMHAVWAKVQGDVTSVCSGTVFPLWVDNQMSCAVAQEEYGIFATTGGSKPDAFIGFETTSSGYDQLFYFDETFNSGAGTCVTTDAVPGGNQDARIKVYYNATQYYIPLYR